MSINQRKYVPNLSKLQATCDVNYGKLLGLLPACDDDSLQYRFNNGKDLTYDIHIVEVSPYTTTLDICQQHRGLPDYVQPTMQVRLYHDVRMAEVLKSQHVGAFRASYAYPNKRMHQPNEKEMVNTFLYEWLQFCHKHIGSREMFNQ
ncbi:DUF1249 domain-containing protein [Alteromonadaceae bacterium BrNp21-10]|nr:DUF1249 domain-containing protein [Alteromonadaceae bacterium BrNp21-10]